MSARRRRNANGRKNARRRGRGRGNAQSLTRGHQLGCPHPPSRQHRSLARRGLLRLRYPLPWRVRLPPRSGRRVPLSISRICHGRCQLLLPRWLPRRPRPRAPRCRPPPRDHRRSGLIPRTTMSTTRIAGSAARCRRHRPPQRSRGHARSARPSARVGRAGSRAHHRHRRNSSTSTWSQSFHSGRRGVERVSMLLVLERIVGFNQGEFCGAT